MKNQYTAVVKQEEDWWVGWIEEIPGVNCQEKTYEELKATLKITLKEALELIDSLSFRSQKEKHELSHLYEAKIRNMGNAGRNGGELDTSKLPQLIELKYHSVGDAVAELGSVANIREVFVGFQRHLY